MPIDFNPHFWFNNNNISHKIVHQSFINNQPIQGTYVKTIPEIKISKKDLGTCIGNFTQRTTRKRCKFT